jgi:hypothetical protein
VSMVTVSEIPRRLAVPARSGTLTRPTKANIPARALAPAKAPKVATVAAERKGRTGALAGVEVAGISAVMTPVAFREAPAPRPQRPPPSAITPVR